MSAKTININPEESPLSFNLTQIKRYGGRLGYRDSRIGEKSWRFRSSSDRGTVRGSDGHN